MYRKIMRLFYRSKGNRPDELKILDSFKNQASFENDYKLLQESILFDDEFYFKEYPDLAKNKVDPIIHFLEFGAAEHRKPSEQFDTQFYLNKYADVKESNINPLIHFLKYGEKEGRKINDIAEIENQLCNNELTDGYGTNPSDTNNLIENEAIRIIKESGLFNQEFYLKVNQDVALAKLDPIYHYCVHGWKEGRNPNKDFDTKIYLKKYSDVRESAINPFVHFIQYGQAEGRDSIEIKETEKKYITFNYSPDYVTISTKVLDYFRKKKSNNKIVVYTCIVDNYDTLKIPECLNPEIDYVIFSDKFYSGIHPWDFKYIDYYHTDPTMICRFYKLNPHLYFPDYETVIWLDGTLLIKDGNDFNELIKNHKQSEKLISTCNHPYRDCIYDEAQQCIEQKKDDVDIIVEQINEYLSKDFPRNFGLAETMILISSIQDGRVKEFFNLWWEELQKYSARDQISMSWVLFKMNSMFNHLYSDGFDYRIQNKYFKYFLHRDNTDRLFPEKYVFPTLNPYNNNFCEYTPVIKTGIKKQDFFGNLNLDKTVDVILPVYNAYDSLKICLSSLVNSIKDNGVRLIIVNDKSEAETTSYLRQFSEKYKFNRRIILLENEENIGYTKSINIGIKYSGRTDYKIILNSDTIVPSNWIEKIVKCGESSKQIGIIGPISNAATWQSVKDLENDNGFIVNELPNNMDVESVNRFTERIKFRSYPKVKLLNGFCYAVKNEVFEKLGLFDEEAFPVGFGEEDDFSIRTLNAGYNLVVDLNTYVFHAKSKSFGNEKRQELTKLGSKNLKEKHGEKRISILCKTMRENPYLKSTRRLFSYIEKPEIVVNERKYIVVIYESTNDSISIAGSSFIRLPNICKQFPDLNAIYLSKEMFVRNLENIPYITNNIFCNRFTITGIKNELKFLKDDYQIEINYDIDDYLFNNMDLESQTNFIESISLCDNISVSTVNLKEFLASRINNKNISVYSNRLDRNLWFPFEKEIQWRNISKDDEVKVLYMGTYTHLNDLIIVEEAIKKTKQKYSKIDFICIGGTKENPDWMTKISPPSMNYPDFVKWFLDFTKDVDFAICPLADTKFNSFKSFIKYLDYSACKLPALYSNINVYSDVIRNNENGILVNNTNEEWTESIEFMLFNQEKRKEIAMQAYNDVYQNHSYESLSIN